jgi:hypothetical protein
MLQRNGFEPILKYGHCHLKIDENGAEVGSIAEPAGV